ncbi:MAG: reverse transcriptase domain-containing protein [bacterium]|nr:reverse transcriptase domain-containing protein [bacterium]MDE0235025.1 reverse transcriptase domain-containing protein [bacterium]
MSNRKLNLTRTEDELRTLFFDLQSTRDIAAILEVSLNDLNYWIYRTPENHRYQSLYIPKKNGQVRSLHAPNTNIKILQQKLNQVFQSVYRPKPSVHGFARERSVRTNADSHCDKRWVFNVDLKDFFHTIHFGRVRGMLMAKHYNLPTKVATVLAHISCFRGVLPQGAPTSPVLSNMICAQMDSQLQTLARTHQSTYTRYADDITFSTSTRTISPEIACFTDNKVEPGARLTEIVNANGFQINSRKVWLSSERRRQVVTGITVNKFPNLPRAYRNQIRAMLYAWRKHGLAKAQSEWERRHSSHYRAPWRRHPRFEQVLKGKIEYLGMIRGLDDMMYLRFIDQLGDLDPQLTSGRGTPLRLLRNSFDKLSADSTNPQKRGHEFERLVSSIFELSEISVAKGFIRSIGKDQIDDAFKLDSWFYLVECKWTKRKPGRPDIDVFYSKVERSGGQTMGVFVSVNGWSKNVESRLTSNSRNIVFLVDGRDIRAVLSEEISLGRMIQAKLEALNLKSQPFLSVCDILSEINRE